MEQHRIEVLLEAESPICHLAETMGNSGILNTRKIRQLDGSFARVPEISGDAMRHGLREAAAWLELEAIGVTEKPELSEAALRLLFAGGMVTGKGDTGTVRLGEYRKLVEMVPALALLGGCAENRTIPGRLDVEPATLVCAEAARFLPPWIAEAVGPTTVAETCRAYVEEVQRVRMDPSLDPGKRALLDAGSADAIERRLDASERASREENAAAKDAAKSTMMPRRVETLVQGALFSWTVTVTLHGALEMDVFYAMFLAFASRMVVGGKRAVGCGKMRVVRAQRTVLRRATELPAPEEVGLATLREVQIGRVLLDHLQARKSAIVEYLKGVNA